MYILFSGLLGLIVGSFLNVVILRLPKEEDLTGRSHCNYCKRQLTSWELIPVVSYLALGGRCYGCKNKISPRYFIIEIITALLFLISYLMIEPNSVLGLLQLLRAWLVVSVFITVFVIDLEHFLILDKVVIFSTTALLLLNFFLDVAAGQRFFGLNSYTLGGIVSSLVLFMVFFSIYHVSNGKWLGFGDVKFMLVYGLALGWSGGLVGFFLTFILGTLYSLPLLLMGMKKLKSQLPLGVFLASAGVLALFFGQEILNWYLSLLGL